MTTEILLDYPIEWDGEIVRSLMMRPPTLEERELVERKGFSKYGKALALIALLSGRSKKFVREIEMVDALKIQEFLAPHMPGL